MSERSSLRRAVRKLPVVRDTIDHAFHPLKIEADLGEKVACRKGCAHCCHQLVTVTMPEAIDLYLAAMENRFLVSRVSQWCDAQALAIGRGMTSRQWFKTGQRCVFLTDANDCAVYERRPFPCRTLVALDTADNCRPEATDPTVKRADHRPAFRHVYIHTARAAEEAGLPVGMIPLPIAMQWAAVLWNEGRDALRRYLDRAGIPAYDHVAHAAYWAERLEHDVEVERTEPV